MESVMEPKIKDRLINLLGRDKITFNFEERLCYSRDITPICYKWIRWHGLPPYLCDCVVFPDGRDEITKILRFANSQNIPVTTYGGGSGSVGGILPLKGGITIDMGKFNRIENFDPVSGLVTVGSGIIGDELEIFLHERGFSLRHFPQSLRSASIGGLIATRSTGQFSTKYGSIEDFVRSLEVILPNGKIIKTLTAPRYSTGPDLKNLFIGSEGIYGIIIRAAMKIHPLPEVMKFQCFIAKNFSDGISSIRKIMQYGIHPAVVRFYNQTESELKFKSLGLKLKGFLLIYCFEGNKGIVEAELKETRKINTDLNLQYIGEDLGVLWYKHRYDTKRIMEFNRMEGGISDAIEISVKWSNLENVYNSIDDYFTSQKIQIASHVSHVYHDGASIYNIFYINEKDEKTAVQTFFKLWREVLKIAMENGASISHHHGIGIIKNEELKTELGYGYEVLHDLKKVVDPKYILNSGKLIRENKNV